MAGRKDYEQWFILNAQLNGSFSSAFSKAQQEFSRLGREIKDLDRVQKDVSGYQKQQAAIAHTEKRIQNLTAQQALLKEQMKTASADALPELKQKYLKLDQSIRDTEITLERQRQKLADTGQRLKEAGVDTAELAQKDAELTAKLKELREAQEKAAQGAKTFGELAEEGFSAAGAALAAAGITAALKEAADACMECVSIAADFEETMSTVEALSGASGEEMDRLCERAKALGAATKYTATEAAQAMTYMAMAGWDAQEMLSGIDGVIQLAAAAGEDLAQVSDIVTDNLTAFGLTAADTAHFSDVLAAAATSSNTSVSIMGDTFRNCASIAGALGYSIDDVAVAVGLMANAGVKGSNAGTALKNTLNGLVSGITLTGDALGEYEFSALRADGTMKSFAATVDELRRCFQQMTPEERFANAQAIAGQRTYNGLLAILNATDEEYASLSASIANCTGAAKEMAAVKMDNLNGQLALLNSAWDAVRTTLGEQLIPELRSLASAGTDALGLLDSFLQKHGQGVKAVLLATSTLGGAAAAITAVNAAVKAFKALNMAAAFTSVPGMAVMAAAGLAAAAAAAFELADAGGEAAEAWEALADSHREALEAYQSGAEAIDNEEAATLGLLESLRALSGQSEKTAADQAQIAALCDQLNAAVPELSLYYDTQSDSLMGLSGSLDGYIEGLYRAQRMERDVSRLVELRGSLEETRAALEEAQAAAAELEAEYDRLALEGSDVFGVNQELAVYKANVAELAGLLAEEEAEYNRLTDSVNAYSAAQEEAAEGTGSLAGVLDAAAAELDILAAAYSNAYGAALESIEGQYALWDRAAEAAAVSAGSINAALESQTRYWEDYNTNLRNLAERGTDIEGLSAVIASFADGSADSVNAIAGMASASDEDLRDMVANWQELQSQQQETADAMAQLVAEVPGQMEELVQAVAGGVEDLSMPETAAKSARETIQAFIDQADSMTGWVQSAYARLGKAAADAMGTPAPSGSAGYSYFDIPGHYASGTENAPPGWAWVGEEGPELLRLRGGETVLPAGISQKYAALSAENARLNAPRGASAAARAPEGTGASPVQALSLPAAGPISVQFSILVEGNASEETAASIRDYVESADFKERILDVVSESQADTRRRAMR